MAEKRVIQRIDGDDGSRRHSRLQLKRLMDVTHSSDNRSEPPSPAAGGFNRLAHELRTPLAAIQALADALAQGYLGPVDNPRHVSYVASIRETARHALAVVDGMTGRNAGVPSSEHPVTVDLAEISRELVASLALLAARTAVRIEVSDLCKPALCAVNSTEFRRMLLNLLTNALLHGGAGAVVQVHTGAAADGHVFVEVVDNGPGIPNGIIERLALGATLDDAEAEGARARIGLVMTQALAGANGGRLEIVSNGQGTRARLLLRAAEGASTRPPITA